MLIRIQIIKGELNAESQIFHEPAQWKAVKAF
jgi:hypothetical protein